MEITKFDDEMLRRLNSATQYPSILTYHVLGRKGRLTEERTVEFDSVDPASLRVTEKIDGTSARLIVPPSGVGNVLVGSRTELLHHDGDVIANPAQDIVATVRGWLREVRGLAAEPDGPWTVVFGEVYGGRVTGGSKNYTRDADTRGFRLFDVARIPADVPARERSAIAAWRDGGGQPFLGTAELAETAERHGFDLVPALDVAEPPPASVVDTHEWLRAAIDVTHAALDDSAVAQPEGVVVRSADRSRIAKIRFEDYERTARG